MHFMFSAYRVTLFHIGDEIWLTNLCLHKRVSVKADSWSQVLLHIRDCIHAYSYSMIFKGISAKKNGRKPTQFPPVGEQVEGV